VLYLAGEDEAIQDNSPSCHDFDLLLEKHESCEKLEQTQVEDDTVLDIQYLQKAGRTFKCDVCSKMLMNKETLRRHMRLHAEKTHKCQYCSKCFLYSSDLKKHTYTHTGEKPFMCDVCSKSFSTESSLKVHMRTRTGLKPFMCNVCFKSFSQKVTLNTT